MRETLSATSGTWQSTLVVRDAGLPEDKGRTWLQVDIEHQPADDKQFPTKANTPKLVRLLLDSLEARDGQADVATAPAFIEPQDVSDLIEELCDVEVRLPVVIATVPYHSRARQPVGGQLVERRLGRPARTQPLRRSLSEGNRRR
ncbi:hypothetical protein [Streptomyces cyaneofuscatus]|uniref:hypothetical protein n=1 Tax=Streptomyces cyaneofuscatus TaxID=66883 RepID=UPI002E155763|nr:hypothetical protein OG366_30215 [Streptomyces cyaneofuscatus]